jgi:hypothetical protein
MLRPKQELPAMRFSRHSSFLALVALFALAPAWAVSSETPAVRGPVYDPATEVTVTGTVAQVLRHTPERRREIHLLLDTAPGKQLEVHIAPAYFLAWKQFTFERGDRLELVVSKAKNEPHYLARSVTKGARTLVLRDPSGKPLWRRSGSR